MLIFKYKIMYVVPLQCYYNFQFWANNIFLLLILQQNLYLNFAVHETLYPFYVSGLFLYPLRTSENQRFSHIFRGYRKKLVEWNRLKLYTNGYCFCHNNCKTKDEQLLYPKTGYGEYKVKPRDLTFYIMILFKFI